nr:unnamed protein product [Callosobruchus analis]
MRKEKLNNKASTLRDVTYAAVPQVSILEPLSFIMYGVSALNYIEGQSNGRYIICSDLISALSAINNNPWIL